MHFSAYLLHLVELDLSPFKGAVGIIEAQIFPRCVIDQSNMSSVFSEHSDGHCVSQLHLLLEGLSCVFDVLGSGLVTPKRRVGAEREEARGRAREFFDKVKGIAILESLVPGVVVGIGFFKQEWPDVD